MLALAVAMTAAIFVVPLSMGTSVPAVSIVPPGKVLDDAAIRRAAENGDHAAQFKLGEAFFEAYFQDSARSDKKGSDEAVRWLETAAQGGNVDAMVYLGRMLRAGIGILQNFDKAFVWIQAAARRGSPEGMLEMGRLYRDGVGVEKDWIKAYVWFNRAAAAHSIDAVREREAISVILTAEKLREAQQQSLLSEHENDEGRAGFVK
jgi:TPR repeat protein